MSDSILEESGWKRLDEHRFEVVVSEHLVNSYLGLGIGVRKIPFSERRQFRSFRLEKEEHRDDKRYWIIYAE